MDAETFKERYLVYHAKLYRLAFRYMGNREDAEDMVQETYLKLWKQRDNLPEPRSAGAFLSVLLKHLCVDALRKRHDNECRESLTENLQISDGADASDVRLERKEDGRLLMRIIGQLPPQQKQVLLMRDVRGCSVEEIGEIMGLTEVNVRVLLSRARKKMRELYIKKRNL